MSLLGVSMVATDNKTVVISPEELLDSLGRISDTRITYKWHGDKKLQFEINAIEQKIQYFSKIAHVVKRYIEIERDIEVSFAVSAYVEQEEDDDDGALEVKPSQHFMPNKAINRLILIFQSPEQDFRVFRFEAGEGILKGHQYFEPDPNIVDIECNSIQKSIQICSKSNKSKVFNVFEMNSNCIGIKQFKERYEKAFSKMPDAVKRFAVISLVRINPRQSKEEFEKRIGFARILVRKVFLSLAVDDFIDKQLFFNSLPVDGFILTMGAREMKKQDKIVKIQMLKESTEIRKQLLFLFYDPFQKIQPLVPGTKEVLYLNKFET